jgi:hypothetical protein
MGEKKYLEDHLRPLSVPDNNVMAQWIRVKEFQSVRLQEDTRFNDLQPACVCHRRLTVGYLIRNVVTGHCVWTGGSCISQVKRDEIVSLKKRNRYNPGMSARVYEEFDLGEYVSSLTRRAELIATLMDFLLRRVLIKRAKRELARLKKMAQAREEQRRLREKEAKRTSEEHRLRLEREAKWAQDECLRRHAREAEQKRIRKLQEEEECRRKKEAELARARKNEEDKRKAEKELRAEASHRYAISVSSKRLSKEIERNVLRFIQSNKSFWSFTLLEISSHPDFTEWCNNLTKSS